MTPGKLVQHITGAFVAVALMAPLLWMVLDRAPPYQIAGGRITPEEPHPGELVTVQWDIKVLRACPASPYSTVTRFIIDSKGVRHDYAVIPATYDPLSNASQIVRTLQLPQAMPPGLAKYKAIACYPCNPIQQYWLVCVYSPEIQFTVKDRNGL